MEAVAAELACQSPCKRCGGRLEIMIREKQPPYAQLTCDGCGYVDWVQKPDSDSSKYRRPKAHRNLVHKFSNGFCEMCLCPESELPKGRLLEAHHVQEYQNGGEASRENIWILCTGCHSLVNWVRTYRGESDHREVVQQVAEGATAWMRS